MIKKLVLASQSPRRRELLTYLDIPFTVESPECDEDLNASLSHAMQIEELAMRKAQSVFDKDPERTVLGADTVIVCDGEVVGKPQDIEDAKQTLLKLSGNTHEVITGVCLMSAHHTETFHVTSKVKFFDLTEEDVDNYLATKESLDKAGSYSIQGKGALLIEAIEGDYYAIMGLPISKIHQVIKKCEW